MFFCNPHPCRCRPAEPTPLRPLHHLKEGQSGVIRQIKTCDAERGRLLALGFVTGRTVRVLRNAQGPMVVLLGSSRVCLCRHQAQHILVHVDSPQKEGEDIPPRDTSSNGGLCGI